MQQLQRIDKYLIAYGFYILWHTQNGNRQSRISRTVSTFGAAWATQYASSGCFSK